MTARATIRKKGGPGSGHFDHAGRPGKVGGSQPDSGKTGMDDSGVLRISRKKPAPPPPVSTGKRPSIDRYHELEPEFFDVDYDLAESGEGGRIADVWKDIIDTWEGDRKQLAGEAASEIDQGGAGFILRDGDEVIAVMSYADPSEDTEYIDAWHFGTKRAGYGTYAMLHLAQLANGYGKGISLTSADSARGFYERLGMNNAGGKASTYWWYPEQITEILEDLYNG